MLEYGVMRRPPLSEPADMLLADVAIRIQLSPTDYGKAEQHYQALADWIDRPGSPLEGLVELVYAQGSMAIGATIASRLTTDEFDADAIAQLSLSPDVAPATALDLLYESIRGEPGSRYYDKTERQSRCTTVCYPDMHVDLTPMVRLWHRSERTGHLFHSKPEEARHFDRTLIANPYGFAEWFKAATPLDHDFAVAFSERARGLEQVVAAESEELPGQTHVSQKSKAVIVLQLLKRWRNVRYDQRQGRRPPSVLLAKLVAEAANKTGSLSEELLHQAQAMLAEFWRWHVHGSLIQVENPACPNDDILTDRWPGTLAAQGQFIDDLEDLVVKTERLVAGCPLHEMREILADLFGEFPAQQAVAAFNDRTGAEIRQGHSQHGAGGRLVLPATGLFTSTGVASSHATPRHTFFGGNWRRRS
ncbi:nucleotidyltransferase [Marinibaculum pumilum]|uniref:Nucleotidyltransferase n=1 Tax=Marinibaculum pumilum TaxID=1766165 RepID=A0ABV7L6Y4_9PROT